MKLNFKYYKGTVLTILIGVILLPFIGWLVPVLKVSIFKFTGLDINLGTNTALLISAFALIDKFLHRIPLLWNLLMDVPLIRGLYKGKISYIINGIELEKICEMKILQTTSKIKIDTTFWNENKYQEKIISTETTSQSLVEDFILNDRDLYELHYFYQNNGSYDSSIPIRMGYNKLEYQIKEQRFEGVYFSRNSKAKGNGGIIKLNFKNKLK